MDSRAPVRGLAAVALLAASAGAFVAPSVPSTAAPSETALQFGFLKELGLEKPDFLPDFGAKDEPEEELSYENGIAVGDAFPKSALKRFGVAGKRSVVYFYGADDAPSCKKQNAAFNDRLSEFQSLGATVVGVRNEKGAKGEDPELLQALMVDEGDAVREQIGIPKDLFGLLGGRETYVVGKDGRVEYKFNDQFGPEKHVENTLDFLGN